MSVFCLYSHDGSMFCLLHIHILFTFGWRHQALDNNTKSHFLSWVFMGN